MTGRGTAEGPSSMTPEGHVQVQGLDGGGVHREHDDRLWRMLSIETVDDSPQRDGGEMIKGTAPRIDPPRCFGGQLHWQPGRVDPTGDCHAILPGHQACSEARDTGRDLNHLQCDKRYCTYLAAASRGLEDLRA
jgi:hypothetical protein